MDHFYQNVEGWMSKQNTGMLDRVIELLPQNSVWVELGAWTGRSASYCVVELINKNKFFKFYCVDDWTGGIDLKETNIAKENSVKTLFLKNIEPIKSNITVIDSLSWDAAINFEDESVDFCYVDAGHTYECVANDLASWWPKIKKDAYFGGDDFTNDFPGVIKAVTEFFENKKINVEKIGRCWLVKKI
jgi:hypothetical protein